MATKSKTTNKAEAAETSTNSSELSTRLTAILKSRVFFVIVVIILACIPIAYFYHQSQTKKATDKLEFVDQVVKQVDRHYILPVGESPTLATVSDVNRVRSQAFFANAANGDKVLVYAKARKAILYRPSADKIVEVAPLEIGNQQQ